jgi:hypothetical protein
MKYLKYFLIIVLFQFSSYAYTQIPALSGGLAFSSGAEYNSLPTGNPAIYTRAYFKLNKQLKIAPSITFFAPKKKFYPVESATHKNFMIHGDFDALYSIYKDDPLRIIGFAGLNATSIISRWDVTLNPNTTNNTSFGLGINLGGAINMFVDNSFDAFISGKYIAGTYSQFVINIGVIYYPEGLRRKGGW